VVAFDRDFVVGAAVEAVVEVVVVAVVVVVVAVLVDESSVFLEAAPRVRLV
jgi:hypothetical protein